MCIVLKDTTNQRKRQHDSNDSIRDCCEWNSPLTQLAYNKLSATNPRTMRKPDRNTRGHTHTNRTEQSKKHPIGWMFRHELNHIDGTRQAYDIQQAKELENVKSTAIRWLGSSMFTRTYKHDTNKNGSLCDMEQRFAQYRKHNMPPVCVYVDGASPSGCAQQSHIVLPHRLQRPKDMCFPLCERHMCGMAAIAFHVRLLLYSCFQADNNKRKHWHTIRPVDDCRTSCVFPTQRVFQLGWSDDGVSYLHQFYHSGWVS